MREGLLAMTVEASEPNGIKSLLIPLFLRGTYSTDFGWYFMFHPHLNPLPSREREWYGILRQARDENKLKVKSQRSKVQVKSQR